MTQPTSQDTGPGQVQADEAGAMALERIKMLSLQIHIGLLAGMQIVRAAPRNDDIIALVNHWASIASLLGEAEQLLVVHLGAAPRTDLH